MIETMTKTGFEMVDYLPQHCLDILADGAAEPGLVADERTIKFAKEAGLRGDCKTGMLDGRPVSAGGFEMFWPGFAEIWMICIAGIGKCHIDPAAAKGWIYDHIEKNRLWRVQTPLHADFPAGEQYVRWLGFEFEYRVPCYHIDGSDALMYSIINRQYLKGD